MARKSLLCVRKFPLVSRKCCSLAPCSFVLSFCTEKGGKFELKGIRPESGHQILKMYYYLGYCFSGPNMHGVVEYTIFPTLLLKIIGGS